jgi:hypothetical protein
MSPNSFWAYAELVNENDVSVDIDSVTLRLLDASGGEIAHSEFSLYVFKKTFDVGGKTLEVSVCDTPIAPRGELGLELRMTPAPAVVASYELEVTPRETHVTADAFSVSDVVPAAKELPVGPPATQIDARVTNRSGETQQGVSVCCGFYDHDVLDRVGYSSLYTYGSFGTTPIESLAPGASAPFHCESGSSPNTLQPRFWVQSVTLRDQLGKEESDGVSGGQ